MSNFATIFDLWSGSSKNGKWVGPRKNFSISINTKTKKAYDWSQGQTLFDKDGRYINELYS